MCLDCRHRGPNTSILKSDPPEESESQSGPCICHALDGSKYPLSLVPTPVISDHQAPGPGPQPLPIRIRSSIASREVTTTVQRPDFTQKSRAWQPFYYYSAWSSYDILVLLQVSPEKSSHASCLTR